MFWGGNKKKAGQADACRVCGTLLADEPSFEDTQGLRYCGPCLTGLRAEGYEVLDGVIPEFRCTLCGQPRRIEQLSERDGQLICRQCLAVGSGSEAGDESEEDHAAEEDAERREVTRLLKSPLPPNLLGKVTCPHCWHIFPTDQLLWVSQHVDLLGDPVLGPEAQLRFRPSRYNLQGEALDARDMPCQLLACPRCHLLVPRAIVEANPLFVSIIGAPSSGKSHFLASMTWQLRRVLPQKFAVAFNDADTVSNHSLNQYEETLFLQSDMDRPVAIRKTELHGELYDQIRLGQQVLTLPKPFLFTLRPPPGPGAETGQGGVRVMCLYDNAGEHFQPGMDSVSSPGTQHLARSRVLMFLYDPTQHPRFREECRKVSGDPQLHGAARNSRQDVILTEAALRVRRYTGLSPHKRHDRPLIVIVAKADIWAPLVGEDFKAEPLAANPQLPGRSALDLERVERVSAKLRRALLILAPEFVAAAEDFCSRVLYVPVSALGRGPEVDEQTGMLGVRPKDVRPRWVTVPVLYALARWATGLIGGVGGAPEESLMVGAAAAGAGAATGSAAATSSAATSSAARGATTGGNGDGKGDGTGSAAKPDHPVRAAAKQQRT